MEHGLDRFSLDVDEHNWELNDLLGVEFYTVFVVARALEVEHADVVKRRLMEVLFSLEIHHVSEVIGWDAAVLETLGKDDFVRRDPERHLVGAMHGFSHIDIDHDLTR